MKSVTMSRKVGLLAMVSLLVPMLSIFVQVNAAAFTEFSVQPSRVEVGITDVNFLIKADAVTVSTEDEVRVLFDAGYSVDATPANITTSTAGIASWDAECVNAWPGIGATASAVSSNQVDFASGDLTVGQTYCFIITAGIDNPAAAGQYSVNVSTREASSSVDTGAITLPTVDDDQVVINATVAPFVRCDVSTTAGADNQIDLGNLIYGSVTSSSTLTSPDNILVEGGTNAGEGMQFIYRSVTNNGLFSPSETATLDGSNAEATINATTTTCAPGTPCFGIYYNGTTTSSTGSFVADADFTGGTTTTDVGPITSNIYGEVIGTSNSLPASQLTAQFNVNATAAEDSPAAADYSETLIFTCKADI